MRNALLSCIVSMLCVIDAWAISAPTASSRRTNQTNTARGSVSWANLPTTSQQTTPTPPTESKPDVEIPEIIPTPEPTPMPKPTNPERDACLARAATTFDTYVWASKNSNPTSYYSMREDTSNPDNNACFIKVSVTNTDERIDTHDIPSRYFMVGQRAKCGDWLDEQDLEQRILDATKKGRIAGAVATSLVSAGVGVGIAEGAMKIAESKGSTSKLMGQKGLNNNKDLLKSQLLKLKRTNPSKYDTLIAAMTTLDQKCDEAWTDNTCKPPECDEANNPFRNLRAELAAATSNNSEGQ